MPLANRLAAEFIGTLWLVLGGCGSAVLAAAFPSGDPTNPFAPLSQAVIPPILSALPSSVCRWPSV